MSILLALLLQAAPLTAPCEVRHVRTEEQAKAVVRDFRSKGYSIKITQDRKTKVDNLPLPYSRMQMQMTYKATISGC